MGIDPIGKGPGPITPPSAPSTSDVSSTEAFSVERTTEASEIEATSPLDRLRAGEVDVGGYLDLRVEAATSHLVGHIDDAKLDFIRSSLRAQLEQDPGLVQLVQKATKSTQNRLKGG